MALPRDCAVPTDDELAAFDRRGKELLLSDAFAWTISGETAIDGQQRRL